MISDEQIETCRLAANESYRRHEASIRGQIIMPEDDWEWHFAKSIFKLAQEVKPLEWIEVSDALKVVKTVFGEYGVFISGYVTSAKFAGDDYYSRLFITEAEAIEAANVDYKRRALSCLVNGGV